MKEFGTFSYVDIVVFLKLCCRSNFCLICVRTLMFEVKLQIAMSTCDFSCHESPHNLSPLIKIENRFSVKEISSEINSGETVCIGTPMIIPNNKYYGRVHGTGPYHAALLVTCQVQCSSGECTLKNEMHKIAALSQGENIWS